MAPFFVPESLIKNMSHKTLVMYDAGGDFVFYSPASYSPDDPPEMLYVIGKDWYDYWRKIICEDNLFYAKQGGMGRDGYNVVTLRRCNNSEIRVMPIKGR